MMKKTIEISNIHLKVKHIETSIDYYTKVLGFVAKRIKSDEAILFAVEDKPLIYLHEIPNSIPKTRTTGLYHVAIRLPSRSDLAGLIRHFIKIKYDIYGGSDHLVSEALYMQDPDGNGIEVYVDKDRSLWRFQNNQVMMDTLPFPFDEVLSINPEIIQNKLPSQTTIGHIHLHVHSMEQNKEFYTKLLGFDVMFDIRSALFLAYDQYHHHIGINIWNGINASFPKENQVGLKYFTIQVYDRIKFNEIRNRLIDQNAIIFDEMMMFFTKDYSNNLIQFILHTKNAN